MGPAPNFSCAPRIDIKSSRNHIGSVSDRDRIGSHRDRIGSGWDRVGLGRVGGLRGALLGSDGF